jgi:hypothetical protein
VTEVGDLHQLARLRISLRASAAGVKGGGQCSDLEVEAGIAKGATIATLGTPAGPPGHLVCQAVAAKIEALGEGVEAVLRQS